MKWFDGSGNGRKDTNEITTATVCTHEKKYVHIYVL